jgi:hypothetical protein
MGVAPRLAALLLLSLAAMPARTEGLFETKTVKVDPEARDAVDLFSRVCLSTRGDRAQATAIMDTGGSAVEPLDAKLLPQLQGGKPGGVGWKIRMPSGEQLLIDFAPDGACMVRAPRVQAQALEARLDELLDQVSASGRFKVHPRGGEVKTIDKLKYRFISYSMGLPDTGNTADILAATTDAKDVLIQGTLSFRVESAKP